MLKAGTYYVGDLCYLIGDENGWSWSEVLDATGFLGLYRPGTEERLDPDENTGYFTHKGVKFFSSNTAYGDGSYYDEEGRRYYVDAGLIGCFPLDALPEGAGKVGTTAFGGGQIVVFEHDFSCHTCDDEDDGAITIGHVRIETDPSEDEDCCGYCGDRYCEGECEEDEDEEDVA